METLVFVVLVPLVNVVTGWFKRKFWFDGKVALVIVAAIVALLYVVFKRISPETFQSEVHEFASAVWFYAVIVYEFLLKKSKEEG